MVFLEFEQVCCSRLRFNNFKRMAWLILVGCVLAILVLDGNLRMPIYGGPRVCKHTGYQVMKFDSILRILILRWCKVLRPGYQGNLTRSAVV